MVSLGKTLNCKLYISWLMVKINYNKLQLLIRAGQDAGGGVSPESWTVEVEGSGGCL